MAFNVLIIYYFVLITYNDVILVLFALFKIKAVSPFFRI